MQYVKIWIILGLFILKRIRKPVRERILRLWPNDKISHPGAIAQDNGRITPLYPQSDSWLFSGTPGINLVALGHQGLGDLLAALCLLIY